MLISTIGYFIMYGIPLSGIPEIDDISYVEISNNRLDVQARRFSDIEELEKAVYVTHLLSYKHGTPEMKEPIVEMIFHLKDGTSLSVSANETVCKMKGVCSKGDNEVFIRISERIFFFDFRKCINNFHMLSLPSFPLL